MNLLRAALLSFTFVLATGCAAETTTEEDTSSDELRSVTFYEKHPFAGARMQKLEKALASIDDEGDFVRNYHRGTGIHFEGRVTDRAALVQAAYAWWNAGDRPSAKKLARDLTEVKGKDLGTALDNIGLEPDMQDAKTDAARASLEKTLSTLASTKGVSVYKATLPKEDMYWHNLLVVVDEEQHEILFETGGFGN